LSKTAKKKKIKGTYTNSVFHDEMSSYAIQHVGKPDKENQSEKQQGDTESDGGVFQADAMKNSQIQEKSGFFV